MISKIFLIMSLHFLLGLVTSVPMVWFVFSGMKMNLFQVAREMTRAEAITVFSMELFQI